MIEAQALTKRHRREAAVDDLTFIAESGASPDFRGRNWAYEPTNRTQRRAS